MPYATQNGPLGVMVQAGQVNPDNRPVSSPMPAYWGIANWTGGQVWPHYKDTFFATTTTDTDAESFAVNNEAGGYNVVLVNKSETATKQLSVVLQNAGSGNYVAYRSNPAAPYAQPAKSATAAYSAGSPLALSLAPMSVTVLVLTKSTIPPPTSTPAPTPPPTSTPAPTPPTSTPPTSTVPVIVIPTAPTGLAVARTPDGATAAVTWQPPTSTGGSPITGYRITRDGADSTGGGGYTTVLPASARSFTFTLLQPSGGYKFSVQAINAAGTGPSASRTSTVSFLPSAPTAVTVARSTPTALAVSWQPPTSTGGSAITGYRVSRDGTDSTGGGAYTTIVAAGIRTFGFSLLNPTSPYHFQVAAITATGTGPSVTVALTTG